MSFASTVHAAASPKASAETLGLNRALLFWDADVIAAKKGDATAKQRLYERSLPIVRSVVVRLVGYQDREDLCQQVYLRLFRSLDRYSGRSAFTTWAWRLAANEALQHLRRVRRQRRILAERWLPVHSECRFDVLESREALSEALQSLDPDLRSIFLLREVEDRSYEEIADALHLASGTVASRLNRARRALRRKLTKLGCDVRG